MLKCRREISCEDMYCKTFTLESLPTEPKLPCIWALYPNTHRCSILAPTHHHRPRTRSGSSRSITTRMRGALNLNFMHATLLAKAKKPLGWHSNKLISPITDSISKRNLFRKKCTSAFKYKVLLKYKEGRKLCESARTTVSPFSFHRGGCWRKQVSKQENIRHI